MTATITERPIRFSGEMVRAILDGRKTQTRRVVKKPRTASHCWESEIDDSECPYGSPGDRLWVRETWQQIEPFGYNEWRTVATPIEPSKYPGRELVYAATPRDGPTDDPPRWRPSIHMPRWASRLTLEVTGVRVERLQEISHDDIVAEGVIYSHCHDDDLESSRARNTAACERAKNIGFGWAWGLWANSWDKINGAKHPWDSNPWVWVVEFK